MKCHCIRRPQAKCRNRLKNWECLLLLYEIIRWENVNQKEECQQYFALRLFLSRECQLSIQTVSY